MIAHIKTTFSFNELLDIKTDGLKKIDIVIGKLKPIIFIKDDKLYRLCENDIYSVEDFKKDSFYGILYNIFIASLRKLDNAQAQSVLSMKNIRFTELESIKKKFSGIYNQLQDKSRVIDNDDSGLNFLNGRLDLLSGKFTKERRKGHTITIKTLLNYEYSQSKEKDIERMEDIFRSFFHDNIYRYCVESIAEMLLGKKITKRQTNYVLLGKGSNGKNTLLELIQKVLPHTVVDVENALLTVDDGNNKASKLLNAIKPYHRFILIDEQGKKKIKANTFKKVANSTITTTKLFTDGSYTIELNGTIVILTNNMLKIDIDDGVKRRLVIIELINKFVDNDSLVDNKTVFKKNHSLIDSFNSAKKKCAFVNYILSFTKDFKTSKFRDLPSDVKKITEATTEMNDLEMEFIDCKLDLTGKSTDRIPKDALLKAYHNFNPEKRNLGLKNFIDDMRSKGLEYDSKNRPKKHEMEEFEVDNKKGLFVGVKFKDRLDELQPNNMNVNHLKMNRLKLMNEKLLKILGDRFPDEIDQFMDDIKNDIGDFNLKVECGKVEKEEKPKEKKCKTKKINDKIKVKLKKSEKDRKKKQEEDEKEYTKKTKNVIKNSKVNDLDDLSYF